MSPQSLEFYFLLKTNFTDKVLKYTTRHVNTLRCKQPHRLYCEEHRWLWTCRCNSICQKEWRVLLLSISSLCTVAALWLPSSHIVSGGPSVCKAGKLSLFDLTCCNPSLADSWIHTERFQGIPLGLPTSQPSSPQSSPQSYLTCLSYVPPSPMVDVLLCLSIPPHASASPFHLSVSFLCLCLSHPLPQGDSWFGRGSSACLSLPLLFSPSLLQCCSFPLYLLLSWAHPWVLQ